MATESVREFIELGGTPLVAVYLLASNNKNYISPSFGDGRLEDDDGRPIVTRHGHKNYPPILRGSIILTTTSWEMPWVDGFIESSR